MSLLESASEVTIHGGVFTPITGNVYIGSHEDSVEVLRLVEKDASLNQYSIENGTVTIPHFSKSLLLRDLQIDPDAGKISTGSCSFNLLARLGLFPGQPNEALAEYDTDVPLDAVVSRGNCYCGRISRHGFIYLVSKYFQHASMEQTARGTCFSLLTTIGRFKCYEIEDRTFIHFDGGTRSSSVDLVANQDLDDILRTARGEYLGTSGASPSSGHNVFEWRRRTGEPLERIASGQFYGMPNAIIYMTQSTIRRWNQLRQFAYVMLDTVLSVLNGLKEPAELISALNNLPPVTTATPERPLDGVGLSTPVEQFASCIYLFRALARKSIGAMSYEQFHSFVTVTLGSMCDAHKYFRSPQVTLKDFIDRSHDRFLQLLDSFQIPDDINGAGRLSNAHIQQELQNLLIKKNNVALVAMQGLLAIHLQWNASRVLLRAREAPDEWIRFLGAEDDEVFIG